MESESTLFDNRIGWQVRGDSPVRFLREASGELCRGHYKFCSSRAKLWNKANLLKEQVAGDERRRTRKSHSGIRRDAPATLRSAESKAGAESNLEAGRMEPHESGRPMISAQAIGLESMRRIG